MSALSEREQLPSGKSIRRLFDKNGALSEEIHAYGLIDIGISFKFSNGQKTEETYLVKKRLASRQSYEKARTHYPDMPTPDNALEDWGKGLLSDLRAQQKRRKTEAEKRLAESEESRFPRPTSTNWLRVIAKDKAHLVVFASRDWKLLSRQSAIPSGTDWLQAFGFLGTPDNGTRRRSIVAEGPEIGYEVPGDRLKMLAASTSLLAEVIAFVKNPPEVSCWQGSIRPRPKPRPKPVPAWPDVLPSLIEFLSGSKEEKLKIFNHHQ